ncbi:STAS domain-containing protein [Alteribacter natronophilus]|uniref:STAS domain-containing protein n=1 Tax=Alteribacter natronophilus TaxID=2583810 RepID=UPI00110E9ADF|nr:STAS domain-containing protein [Alteribacter natronophilus]TMW73358.1 STAS domain-containing protein [Alteribacter natronophilus]
MLNQIPLPYIKINSRFDILHVSDRAKEEFPTVNSFLDIIDRESREKAKKTLERRINNFTLELNLQTKNSPLTLYDVYGHWNGNGEEAHIITVLKDSRMEKVESQLLTLQKRLRNTNFELYEKNEELEESIARNNRLSAPFITLSDRVALVPVYGDLHEEKLLAVQENIYDAVYEGDYEKVLIDFTGVGAIEKDGIHAIKEIFLTLDYMGVTVILIGIQPHHARQMKIYKEELKMTCIHSAQEAIKRFLTGT